MGDLAPGRKADMAMLLERRQKASEAGDGEMWLKAQRRIDHIIEEGKHKQLHGLRERLIGAQAARDQREIEKISAQINEYVYYHRLNNRWIKER